MNVFRFSLLAFPVALAATLLVYWTGLHAGYYSDDFQFAFDLAPPPSALHFFVENIESNGFYRPIQASVLWWIQDSYGLNGLPVHLLHVLLHAAGAALLAGFLRSSGFSVLQAGIAAALMVVSQANVHAVSSVDTLSQVTATLFGYVAVWIAWTRGHTLAGTAWACLLLALALFSKETAASFMPMLGIVLLFRTAQGGLTARAVGTAILRYLPYLAIFVAYYLARAQVVAIQPRLGEEAYTIQLGLNLVENAVLFLASALLPVSSVALFQSLKTGSLALPLAGALLAAATVLATACGLWRERERIRFLAGMAVLLVLSMFPMLLLYHVSELYGYNVTPMVYLLAGIGLGRLAEGGKAARIFTWVLVAAVVAVNAAAVGHKLALVNANSERAASYYAQLEPLARETPEDGELLLVNRPPDAGTPPEYSVFVMNDFNVLEHGTHRIQELLGRTDLTVHLIQAHEVDRFSPEAVVLTLDPGGTRVVRVR